MICGMLGTHMEKDPVAKKNTCLFAHWTFLAYSPINLLFFFQKANFQQAESSNPSEFWRILKCVTILKPSELD